MFVNKHFINADASISKSKRCYHLKSSAYCFYMRKKITLNFRICISVPLIDEAVSNKATSGSNMASQRKKLYPFIFTRSVLYVKQVVYPVANYRFKFNH